MAPHDDPGKNPFDFSSTSIAPIRQVAESAIAYQARRGSLVLFFVAALQLVFMFFFTMYLVAEKVRLQDLEQFVNNPDQLRIPPMVYLSYLLGLILGFLFFGLGFWARKDPLLAPKIGLGIYVAANLFDMVLLFGFGLTVLPAGSWFWLLRLFIVVFLIDAIRAGLAYRRIVNKLIVEAGEIRSGPDQG